MLELLLMKTDIHPKYYSKAQAKCACGNSFEVGSTKDKLEVEVCSECHPLYTGTGKVIDTAGRVEKFKARRAAAIVSKEKKNISTKKNKADDKKK